MYIYLFSKPATRFLQLGARESINPEKTKNKCSCKASKGQVGWLPPDTNKTAQNWIKKVLINWMEIQKNIYLADKDQTNNIRLISDMRKYQTFGSDDFS